MKKQVAVIVKAVNSDFWQVILSGAKAVMREEPERVEVRTYGPPEESDELLQVEILEKVVAEKPDAIVIASTSNDLTVPAIEQAMDAGIPVITVDNQVRTEKVVSFLGTDSYQAAGQAAEAMVENWKKESIVFEGKEFLVVNSSETSKVDLDRDAGFEGRMRELVPSMKQLDTLYTQNDPELTEKLVAEAITSHPDLIGIFADNDMTGAGTARGIRRSGSRTIFAYAFDANAEEIQAVKEGYLKGMVVQKPFELGYRAVKFALDALEGKAVERNVDTGGTIVTKENMKEEVVQKLLYPEKL